MAWWNRWKQLEELKEYVHVLDKNISNVRKEQEKLKRILQYARDDGPSFRHVYDPIGYTIYPLCLYIDKEEYLINIPELSHMFVIDGLTKIRVDDNLAYVDIVGGSEYFGNENGPYHLYHFIIDFKRGTYVCHSAEEGIVCKYGEDKFEFEKRKSYDRVYKTLEGEEDAHETNEEGIGVAVPRR